jgi:hypothetical protein
MQTTKLRFFVKILPEISLKAFAHNNYIHQKGGFLP